MGLRVPQSSWLGMSPQQQMLMANGVMPTGVPMPEDGTPMISPSMPTEEQQKALADLQAAQMQSFQNQQQGINDLSQYTNAQLEQPVQTDLTGLASLTDAWTGSKFAQSYRPPQSGSEKMGQVAALKQALNKERGNLTDSEIALLKAKINALTTQSLFGQKSQAKVGEAMSKEAKDTQKQDEEAREKAIKTDQAKKVEGSIGFIRALKDYEDAVASYGEWDTLAGPAAADLKTKYSNMKAEFGKAKGLGALSGPDLEILIEAMAPQTGMAGAGQKLMGAGKESVAKSAASLRDFSKNEFDTALGALEAGFAGRNIKPVVDRYKTELVKAETSRAKKAKEKTDESEYVAGKTTKTFQGKNYLFMGGNWKDRANWKEK